MEAPLRRPPVRAAAWAAVWDPEVRAVSPRRVVRVKVANPRLVARVRVASPWLRPRTDGHL